MTNGPSYGQRDLFNRSLRQPFSLFVVCFQELKVTSDAEKLRAAQINFD